MILDLANLKAMTKNVEAMPAAFLVASSDDYLLRQALEMLRLRLFGKCERFDACEEVFDISELSSLGLQRALEAHRMVSMFNPRKIVVIRALDKLDSQSNDLLIKYLEQLQPKSENILLAQHSKLRSNSRLKKAFDEYGGVIAHPLDRKPQFEAAIGTIATGKGLHLSRDIVTFLGEFLPRNLTWVNTELEKVRLYIGDRRPTLALVSEVVSAVRVDSIFDLTDAIGNRDVDKALVIYLRMLENSEAPQMILAMIGRHCKLLHRMKVMMTKRTSRKEVGEALGTKSTFVLVKVSRQARQFSLEQLKNALAMCAQTDLLGKRISVPTTSLVEDLIIQLTLKNDTQAKSA